MCQSLRRVKWHLCRSSECFIDARIGVGPTIELLIPRVPTPTRMFNEFERFFHIHAVLRDCIIFGLVAIPDFALRLAYLVTTPIRDTVSDQHHQKPFDSELVS